MHYAVLELGVIFMTHLINIQISFHLY